MIMRAISAMFNVQGTNLGILQKFSDVIRRKASIYDEKTQKVYSKTHFSCMNIENFKNAYIVTSSTSDVFSHEVVRTRKNAMVLEL